MSRNSRSSQFDEVREEAPSFMWEPGELILKRGEKVLSRGRQKAKLYDFFLRYSNCIGEFFAKCRLCSLTVPPIAYSPRTYTNLLSHLQHKSDANHCKALNMHITDKRARQFKRGPASGAENCSSAAPRGSSVGDLLSGPIDQRGFEYAMTLLVAGLNLSFNVSQSPLFKSFLRFFGCPFSIPASHTMKHRLGEMTVTIRDELAGKLSEAKRAANGMPHLHVTTDAWKAHYTGQNYAALTAHFITPDFTLESRVVAAKSFLG